MNAGLCLLAGRIMESLGGCLWLLFILSPTDKAPAQNRRLLYSCGSVARRDTMHPHAPNINGGRSSVHRSQTWYKSVTKDEKMNTGFGRGEDKNPQRLKLLRMDEK